MIFNFFVCSLLFSSVQNELQMALPNIDLSKLSKLRQRLVAPSSFSTQYLFPGNQAFFRDFIICTDFHMMFMEQLKIALISELLQMNDSSMETLSIAPNNDDDDDNKEKSFQQQEFIVSIQSTFFKLFLCHYGTFFLCLRNDIFYLLSIEKEKGWKIFNNQNFLKLLNLLVYKIISKIMTKVQFHGRKYFTQPFLSFAYLH